MKILLGTLNSKFVHTNLALRYLKASIKSEAVVKCSEFTINEDQEGILYEIVKEGYDIVAFSCYIWNIEKILYLAENIKKLNPETIIILGGPEVSYEVQSLMKNNVFIDFVISGEGEISLKKLVIALRNNSEFNGIEGLSYKVGDMIISNLFTPIKNLADVPAAYDEVEYQDIENKIVYYETSRGCGYNCAYCLSSVDKGIRAFPMDRVKHELQKLVKLNAKQIKFVDRTFNYNTQRTVELLNYLISIDNGKINFHFEITAFILNREITEILKSVRTDLFQLEIGVQSTNPDTLEIVGRANRLEEIKKWVAEIKSKGNIHIHLDLIAGLPGEDLESFKKSFNDTFKMFPDMLQLGFLKVLKGAPIHSMAKQYGIKYRAVAPYEVLETNDINYFELKELKNIENILEKTYNNGHGRMIINYIFENCYNNDAYRIFLDLQCIIQEKNILKNKKDWEYMALYYLCEKLPNEEFFKELVVFEYMQNTKGSNLPAYMYKKIAAMNKEPVYDILREHQLVKELKMENLYFKELCKKVKWQYFAYDILKFKETGEIIKINNLLFTNFECYDTVNQNYISSRRFI